MGCERRERGKGEGKGVGDSAVPPGIPKKLLVTGLP